MKKLIFLILIFLISFSLYGQEKHKEIKLDSRTLIRGGEYILIPSTLGRITNVVDLSVSYRHNTTPYTIASTDSVKISTDTPDGELYFVVLTDSTFVKSQSFSTPKIKNIITYTYSNDIKINIPNGKLTTGDGDLYIEINYELLEPKN